MPEIPQHHRRLGSLLAALCDVVGHGDVKAREGLHHGKAEATAGAPRMVFAVVANSGWKGVTALYDPLERRKEAQTTRDPHIQRRRCPCPTNDNVGEGRLLVQGLRCYSAESAGFYRDEVVRALHVLSTSFVPALPAPHHF